MKIPKVNKKRLIRNADKIKKKFREYEDLTDRYISSNRCKIKLNLKGLKEK